MRAALGLIAVSALLLACTWDERPPAQNDDRAPAHPMDHAALVRARSLHDALITIDTHTGFSGGPLRSCDESDRQVDFPKMRRGGLDVIFYTVFARQAERTDAGYARAMQQALDLFRLLHELVERCADSVGLARTPEDVERLAARGMLAIAIGIENGFAIGRDLDLLSTYAGLGAAYVGLTHDGHNDIADAAVPSEELADPPVEHGGVSAFGEQVIARLNELGIMIDVSHMSKAAALDAIRLSRAPVIASHSSMHALVDHPRNMDDETLTALARKGGVVQITPVHEFVKKDPAEVTAVFNALFREFGVETVSEAKLLPSDRREAFRRRYDELSQRWPLATVADFVDHIDHAVRLVGVDHVGIGSDFDGGGELDGWADAGDTPNVTIELIRRGYTEDQIRRIWGGNLLRVWREVRRLASSTNALPPR